MAGFVELNAQVDVPPTWEQWIQFPQSQIALAVLAVSILACLASWVSASSAFRGAGTAKKNLGVATDTLDINSKKFEDENLPLKPDFTFAGFLTRSYGTTYVFDLEITNPAKTANSVRHAPLTLVLADGATRSFDPVPLPPESKKKTSLGLPLDLPPSAHRVGSLAYEVPADFLKVRRIKHFRVDVTDSKGRVTPIKTISVGALT